MKQRIILLLELIGAWVEGYARQLWANPKSVAGLVIALGLLYPVFGFAGFQVGKVASIVNRANGEPLVSVPPDYGIEEISGPQGLVVTLILPKDTNEEDDYIVAEGVKNQMEAAGGGTLIVCTASDPVDDCFGLFHIH